MTYEKLVEEVGQIVIESINALLAPSTDKEYSRVKREIAKELITSIGQTYNEKLEEYRKWLEFQYDLAKDGEYMFTEERPNELSAERAKFHAKGFKEALEEFNSLFPQGEKRKGTYQGALEKKYKKLGWHKPEWHGGGGGGIMG